MTVADDSFAWSRRACDLFPGGVNSPVRSFAAVGGKPFFVARASGARLVTVDGRELVDWVGSWGPMVTGHARAEVVAAVSEALADGSSFGACSPREVLLAEEMRRRMPLLQRIRLVSSGTEAAMTALRVARAVTGRDTFVKFRGCYHGHADSFLVAAGSGALTHGVPSSPGVPADLARHTRLAAFNDLDSVAQAFDEVHGKIAAVFVEPVPGNMGVVPPEPGFLDGLRALCDAHGALLVFDEVMTGFRLARGGATERFGVTPDLLCLGKIAGGGLPLAALGGRADFMDHLAPSGPVYQAGTLSGNPLACAAGLAQLQLLDPLAYQDLEAKGQYLEDAWNAARSLDRLSGATLQRVGSMATVFAYGHPVRSLADALCCDTDRYGRVFHHLLMRGHFVPPAQFEAFFLSTAHTRAELDDLVDAWSEAWEASGSTDRKNDR